MMYRLGFILLALLLSCGPQRRPKTQPFPQTVPRVQIRAYPLNTLRCMGGAIGGCEWWQGSRPDGPVDR